jgi:uncharacterized membrane protein YdbT with pleckstrin-like domain
MEEMFKDILDKDEQVIKVYKPNKRRFVLVNNIASIVVMLAMFVPLMVVGICGLVGVINTAEDGGLAEGALNFTYIPFIIIGCIFLFIFVATIICNVISYKKRFYCFTNKRLIIRRGVIGVDYATLDMNMIGGVTVSVSFLDKFFKPNTGTIYFGSIVNNGGAQNARSLFAFANIENAYVTYREIKEVVDSHKISITDNK